MQPSLKTQLWQVMYTLWLRFDGMYRENLSFCVGV